MSIFKVIAVASLALAAGALVEQAHADQIFICEDGRHLSVGLADIEHMKRTEPCVAAHFGGIKPAQKTQPSSSSIATASITTSSSVALPAANPRRAPWQQTRLRRTPLSATSWARRGGPVDLSNVVILNAGS